MFKLVCMEELVVLEERNTINHTERDTAIHDDRDVISVTLRGNSKIKSKCKDI